MDKRKNLGIWMDHSTANLINITEDNINHSINSKFTFDIKVEALSRSENIMHNKEQQQHEAYYKEIADEILKYDHVLLFGPTKAKLELNNYMNKDLHFKDIKICIEPADKMTDNEKIAFAKNHFEV
ncbi:MAG: hypothetical protein LH629_09455 [Ignavibacteria bacterium]|nr:hypothetical protein [Ignavibacteria bacterium]